MAQYTGEVKGFYPKIKAIVVGSFKFKLTSEDYVRYARKFRLRDIVTVTFVYREVENIELAKQETV